MGALVVPLGAEGPLDVGAVVTEPRGWPAQGPRPAQVGVPQHLVVLGRPREPPRRQLAPWGPLAVYRLQPRPGWRQRPEEVWRDPALPALEAPLEMEVQRQAAPLKSWSRL